VVPTELWKDNFNNNAQKRETAFIDGIKPNVQLRETLILKNKQDQAAVKEVYNAQHVAGE
jgi:hypothetical protein